MVKGHGFNICGAHREAECAFAVEKQLVDGAFKAAAGERRRLKSGRASGMPALGRFQTSEKGR